MLRLKLWQKASRMLFRNIIQPSFRVIWSPFLSVAKTVYVLWILSCRLTGLLGSSPRWMLLLGRLVAFSFLISPALLQLVPYYLCGGLILRGVRYGPHRRNDFDIHIPRDSVHFGPSRQANQSRPVVILFAGGAWMIGYKLWSLALCRTLAALGVIAVAADYRYI